MSLLPPWGEQGSTQQKQTLWDRKVAGPPAPSSVTINSHAQYPLPTPHPQPAPFARPGLCRLRLWGPQLGSRRASYAAFVL